SELPVVCTSTAKFSSLRRIHPLTCVPLAAALASIAKQPLTAAHLREYLRLSRYMCPPCEANRPTGQLVVWLTGPIRLQTSVPFSGHWPVGQMASWPASAKHRS